MIKSLTFNQLLTYEGERFAQSFNITIERMLFFRWCQILVPKFWIGFQYWANVWNDSTICLWKTQQEVLDSPVLECRNWRSERPLLAETVSVAGKVGSQHGPHLKSFFIEIQWQGIILASVCLCKSKMWKSNVKNVFNYFPRWSEVSLIAQSLTGETHQQ